MILVTLYEAPSISTSASDSISPSIKPNFLRRPLQERGDGASSVGSEAASDNGPQLSENSSDNKGGGGGDDASVRQRNWAILRKKMMDGER